ncbi:ABC transporter permease [Nonomuraea longicatena]|uniref:ABC transporter permease n=1 Tax=Nonomuraea longicatena TaxID=83682 RepID=A0ABN1NRR2_9ACTN
MKIALMAGLTLRRMARERTNLFFAVVAPFLLILVLGQTYGGGQELRLGVVAAAEPGAERLAAALASGTRVTVERLPDEAALRAAVERGRLHAGLVIPPGYGAAGVPLRHLVRAIDPKSHDTGTWIRSIVRQDAAGAAPALPVRVTTAGATDFPEGLNAYAVSAPPLLLMFTFLTSLTAALGVVESRSLGVTARLLAGPTPVRTIVLGEAAGRVAVALAQALLIMLGATALFGVSWGDPLGAAAVVAAFSLAGGGAAMLLGASFRTPGPPLSLAMVLGLGLSAAGGTTVPLESFPDALRTLAHLTPHAWGYDAFAALIRHDATLVDVLPQVGVLSAMAAGLFALGARRLRRTLTGG